MSRFLERWKLEQMSPSPGHSCGNVRCPAPWASPSGVQHHTAAWPAAARPAWQLQYQPTAGLDPSAAPDCPGAEPPWPYRVEDSRFGQACGFARSISSAQKLQF